MFRLDIVEIPSKPTYPIIVDLDGVLYPVAEEREFRIMPPSTLEVNRYYMAMDSQGVAWTIRKEPYYRLRIHPNLTGKRITKTQFVSGFNRRKNNPNNEIYSVKVNHKTFAEIFAEVYPKLSVTKLYQL